MKKETEKPERCQECQHEPTGPALAQRHAPWCKTRAELRQHAASVIEQIYAVARQGVWRAGSENETADDECRDGCTLPRGHNGRCSNDPISSALDDLAGFGSDVATLLAAVDGGGHLQLDGPSLLCVRGPQNPFVGYLESNSGARNAAATGQTLAAVVRELAQKWSNKQ